MMKSGATTPRDPCGLRPGMAIDFVDVTHASRGFGGSSAELEGGIWMSGTA